MSTAPSCPLCEFPFRACGSLDRRDYNESPSNRRQDVGLVARESRCVSPHLRTATNPQSGVFSERFGSRNSGSCSRRLPSNRQSNLRRASCMAPHGSGSDDQPASHIRSDEAHPNAPNARRLGSFKTSRRNQLSGMPTYQYFARGFAFHRLARLLQLCVFGFGLLENWNVRIGVFPKGQEFLV